jgi:hypothetical protein
VVLDDEPGCTDAAGERSLGGTHVVQADPHRQVLAGLLRAICSGGGASGGAAWVSDQVSRRTPNIAVAVVVTAPPWLSSTIQCWLLRLVRADSTGDLELSVGDGGGEIHCQSDRLAESVGMRFDRPQQDRGGDPAERAHHVRPLRLCPPPNDARTLAPRAPIARSNACKSGIEMTSLPVRLCCNARFAIVTDDNFFRTVAYIWLNEHQDRPVLVRLQQWHSIPPSLVTWRCLWRRPLTQ